MPHDNGTAIIMKCVDIFKLEEKLLSFGLRFRDVRGGELSSSIQSKLNTSREGYEQSSQFISYIPQSIYFTFVTK